MSGVWWVAAGVFLALVPWGNAFVSWLLAHGIGKRIRADGPEAHEAKAGTPTMGGLCFAGVAILAGIILFAGGNAHVLWPTLAVLAFGGLGAYDDLMGLRDRAGVGWLARQKFPWQWVLGFALAIGMYTVDGARVVRLPVVRSAVDIGLWFIPVGAIYLVGFVNAVNLTDGLDGLAGGTALIVLVLLLYLTVSRGMLGLGYWIAALVGGLLAFLWYNVRPARLFMGDVGSEALGAALASVALVSGYTLLLPLAAIVCVAEALSVMLQVGYFKYTRRTQGEGQRIFRMTPLHHHFEQIGWPEVQVTQRFWIVTAVATIVAAGLWAG